MKAIKIQISTRDHKYPIIIGSGLINKLSKLPKNSLPCRLRNRCIVTGRPRGNYRKFKLSRIAFRELANDGKLPGITKSSW